MSHIINAGTTLHVAVNTKPETTARRAQGRKLDEEVRSASNYLKTWKEQNAPTFAQYKKETIEGFKYPEGMTEAVIAHGLQALADGKASEIDPAYLPFIEEIAEARSTAVFGQMKEAGAKGYAPNIALVYALAITPRPFALIPMFQTEKEVQTAEDLKAKGQKVMTTGSQFAGIVERMLRTPADFNARIIALTLMDNPARLNFSKVVTEKNRQEVVEALNKATEGHALRFATTKAAIKALAPAPRATAPKGEKNAPK